MSRNAVLQKSERHNMNCRQLGNQRTEGLIQRVREKLTLVG